MSQFRRRLRTPEERVGMLPNACLPPPGAPPARELTPEDQLLYRALRDRNEDAFARALDLYFPAMLRLAQTHVDSRATAEEVIQETWMGALRGINRFEGRSSVKTWLFRILRNRARTRGKRDARERPFTDLVPVAENSNDVTSLLTAAGAMRASPMWSNGSDPAQDLLTRELGARLECAIAKLPPRQREVLILRDVEGWSPEDVCNAMAIARTNQRVMLHRARERVRHEIRDYLDDNGCGDDD